MIAHPTEEAIGSPITAVWTKQPAHTDTNMYIGITMTNLTTDAAVIAPASSRSTASVDDLADDTYGVKVGSVSVSGNAADNTFWADSAPVYNKEAVTAGTPAQFYYSANPGSVTFTPTYGIKIKSAPAGEYSGTVTYQLYQNV
jgi:hypothetical protein